MNEDIVRGAGQSRYMGADCSLMRVLGDGIIKPEHRTKGILRVSGFAVAE